MLHVVFKWIQNIQLYGYYNQFPSFPSAIVIYPCAQRFGHIHDYFRKFQAGQWLSQWGHLFSILILMPNCLPESFFFFFLKHQHGV